MTTPDPPAYTPYAVLRLLIQRVGWPDETEKRVALASIDAWERMGIFGNLAVDMACTHPDTDRGGRCTDCGRHRSTI